MNNKKTKEKYNEISEIDYLLKYLFCTDPKKLDKLN